MLNILDCFVFSLIYFKGFDLVGDENVLHPLIYYLDPLLRFKKRQAEEGVDIPFILHAGETLGDGDTSDSNVYDAILLGTKRIGHGLSISFEVLDSLNE